MLYKSLNHKRFITTLALMVVVLMASCTDLTEEVDSQVTADNFFRRGIYLCVMLMVH